MDVDAVLRAFKQSGQFDSWRRHIISELYAEHDLEHLLEDASRNLLERYSKAFPAHKVACLDKYELQQIIQQRMEDDRDMFDHLRQIVVTEILSGSKSGGQGIAESVADIARSLNSGDAHSPQSAETKSPSFDRTSNTKAIDDTIFHDILSIATAVKSVKSAPATSAPAALSNIVSTDADPLASNTTSMEIDKTTNADATSDTTSNMSEQSAVEVVDETLFVEVFKRGQKVAACLSPDNWTVVVIKSFDPKTGTYVGQESGPNKAICHSLPFEKLLHFNHNQKSFEVGDRVWSLRRSREGLETSFSAGIIAKVSGNIVHVKYQDGEVAISRYFDVFHQ